MEPKTKKWKKEELKAKTDMLRNISKQSRESVQSVLKKNRKATVGKMSNFIIPNIKISS